MAKPRKEGLSHTTIRIKWTDKEKLRLIALNRKEPDWSVISRVLSIVNIEAMMAARQANRDCEIGVTTAANPSDLLS